jgi:hypothetical protein
LFFKATARTPTHDFEALAAYFNSRPNYVRDADSFCYGNEDTGINFSFDKSEEAQADPDSLPLAFNINYFRPQVFALEAEPEVRAFVSNFHLQVDDPQEEGMGQGDYSTSGFIRGWNHGNDAACRGFLSLPNLLWPGHTLPSPTIKRLWKWNFERANFQDELINNNVDAFVPKVMFGILDEKLITFVAWTDGMPTYLPQVDKVFIMRYELAPRRLLMKKEDVALADWADIKASLPFKTVERHLTYLAPEYEERPKAVETFIRSLKPAKPEITGISFDQILDRELVAKYRKEPA